MIITAPSVVLHFTQHVHPATERVRKMVYLLLELPAIDTAVTVEGNWMTRAPIAMGQAKFMIPYTT